MKLIKDFLKSILKLLVGILGLFLWVIVMLLPYCLSDKIVEYIDNRS